MALHGAVRPGAGAYVFEDFLHLDDVAFQPGYFRDRRDLALAVGLARELHDELDGAGDLAADRGHRHRQASHADHLLQARDGVARRIGVNGGHRAFVAGVHRLQHVEGFLAAALAEDDAVGPHAQRVLHQFALTDFALAFDIGRPRFHAADMRLLQLKLGGVFDGDQALFFRDEGGQRIEHGGLAGAGAAGNDRGDARLHRRPEQLGHRRTQRADFHQPAEVERLLGKFADRDQGAVDADRPHRHVDARAVLQARVAKRMRFVDAAADRGHDFIDDAQQVILVLEAHRQRLKYAAALHINAFVAVDQDVADGRVLEQRLERTQTGHLVENFRNEVRKLLRVQRQPLGQHVLRHQLLDVSAGFFFGQLFQRRKIDLLDQPAMQSDLGVEQLVAEQPIGGRLRLQRRRRFSRHFRRRRPCRTAERRRRRLFDRRQVWRGNASGCETAGHRLFLFPFYCATESLNFLIGAAVLPSAAGFFAAESTTSFLSCAVTLLPGFTSSSGTPRSIASRTKA